MPEPEVMLREAVRVLRPGGCLVMFEGDYATATMATRAGDPLDACAKAFWEHFVHDPWLVRRLLVLVRAAGGELKLCAAMATWKRRHRDSCWPVGLTWVPRHWRPRAYRDGHGCSVEGRSSPARRERKVFRAHCVRGCGGSQANLSSILITALH